MSAAPPAPSRLLSIARRVRHAPGLAKFERLWRFLRPHYHWALEAVHSSRGIPMHYGTGGLLHAPASFAHNQIDPLEIPLLERLVARTPPHACFYDVGASIGLHSLAAGEQLGIGGEIHAFEPEAASCSQYWANTRLLRQRGIELRLHQCFVSEQSRGFSRQAAGPAASMHTAETPRHLYLFDALSAAKHPAVTLDEYVDDRTRPPTVIKCDIEGAELLFLRGAMRVLRQHRPVLFVSVHPDLLPAFGHSVAEVRAQLEAAGYDWQLIDHVGEMHVLAEPK